MFTKDGQTISLEQAQQAADFSGMSLDAWAAQYGWTKGSSEGKTVGPTKQTPSLDQTTTPAGDSRSGDISLESPKNNDLGRYIELDGRPITEEYYNKNLAGKRTGKGNYPESFDKYAKQWGVEIKDTPITPMPEVTITAKAEGEARTAMDNAKELTDRLANVNKISESSRIAKSELKLKEEVIPGTGGTRTKLVPDVYRPIEHTSGRNWKYKNDLDTDILNELGEEKYNKWKQLEELSGGNITDELLRQAYTDLDFDQEAEAIAINEAKVKTAEVFMRDLSEEEQHDMQRFMGDQDYKAREQDIYEKHLQDERDYKKLTGRDLISPQVVAGREYVPTRYADYSVVAKEKEATLKIKSDELMADNDALMGKWQGLAQSQNAMMEELKALETAMSGIDKNTQDPQQMEVLNGLIDRYNEIVGSEAYVNMNTDWDNLMVEFTAFQDKADEFTNEYSNVQDLTISLEAAAKNYEAIVRLAQVWEEFTLGSLAGLNAAIYGLGEEWIGGEKWTAAKQGMIDYNKYLADKRARTLPSNLSVNDIGDYGASRLDWLGEALINNSPSIAVAMMPMGAAGLAGQGAARMAALKRASAITSTFFGVTEAGGYMADVNVSIETVLENIDALEERLKYAKTQEEKDELNIQLQELRENEYLSLSETQKAFSAIAYGTIAGYAEKIGTLGFLGNIQKYSRAVGYNQFLRVMSKPMARASSKVAGAMKASAIGVGIEEIEETATLLGQNFVDIAVGGIDKNLFEGLDLDFFANVAVSSFAMSGGNTASNVVNAVRDEFRTNDEIKANAELTNKLFKTIKRLENDRLTAQERVALRKERRSILRQLGMGDAQSLLKVKGLDAKDIETVTELNREMRELAKQARSLGYTSDVDNRTNKELDDIKNKYRELQEARETILNKPAEQIKELVKDSERAIEKEFYLSLAQFNTHAVEAFGKNTNIITPGTDVDAKYDPETAKKIKAAIMAGDNALFDGKNIYVFSENITSNILNGSSFDAAMAAVAPLHEVGHQQAKALGIVITDKNSSSGETKFVGDGKAMIESVMNEVKSLYEAGRISKKNYEGFLERVEAYKELGKQYDQYEDTDFLDPDELMQLVGDMTNAGILPKSSYGKVHEIKTFVNSLLRFTGMDPMYFRLENHRDVANFVASWSKKIKEGGKLQLPPDDETSKASISGAAERAKQVLDKVSSNMEYFDPNSPLIASVLPGMVKAQLAPYINKGLKIDLEEAVADVVFRLYSANDIGKFNGKGTLYGYVNGRIKYRILDALKADNDFVEDFSTGDLDDVKGMAAVEIPVAVSEERVEAEKPQYRKLLEWKMLDDATMSEIESKLPRIVGTLKSRIDEQVSKNKTVTPIVNELRLALGKQIDIDLKKAMGGKKDGQLRKWLTANKKALLENMTTTYLMQAMPIAIQKKVDGVWTSEWQGKKIDRETTATDNAGRTSGAELVRRLPQASIKIDDKTFLSYILEESGNPIRGKKESWAKAIAEELAIEMVNREMENPDSKVRQAFEANQERLGVELADNYVQHLALQLERGNVKHSIGIKTLKSENFREKFRTAVVYTQKMLANGRTIDDIIDSNGNWNPTLIDADYTIRSIKGKDQVVRSLTFKDITVSSRANYTENDLTSLIRLVYDKGLIGEQAKGFIAFVNDKSNKQLQEWLASNGIDKAYSLVSSKAENAKQLYANDAHVIAKALGKDIFNLIGKQLLGFGDARYILDYADSNVLDNLSESKLPAGLDLSLVHRYVNGTGILAGVGKILNDENLTADQKVSKYNESYRNTVEVSNFHNRLLATHIAETIIGLARDGQISANSLVQLLQMQTNIGGGFRALASLDYITFTDNPTGAIKIEHLTSNTEVMSRLLELTANTNIEGSVLTSEIRKALSDNNAWLENRYILDTVDTLGRLSKGRDSRMYATGDAHMKNVWHTSGIPAKTMLDRMAIAEQVSTVAPLDLGALSRAVKQNKSEFKSSIGSPQVVFMVGGPGSGKSTVLKGTGLVDKGFRMVNQDPYLEQWLKEAGLPTDERTYDKEQRSIRAKLGHKARKAAEEDMNNFRDAKYHTIVDGTGASFNATRKKMKAFEDAGYTVHVMFVNTSKDVAVQRNRARAERSLADFIVTKTWDSVQESIIKYKEEFGDRVYEINTDNIAYGDKLPQSFLNQVTAGIEASSVKRSIGISQQFNEMIERNKGVAADKVYSSVQAKMLGEKKGKYRIFIPASADDFRGLTAYTFAGKGKQGEADQKFFEEKLIDPYVRGVAQIDAIKQQIRREYHAVAKAHKQYFKMLGKKITNTKYTYDQALRVYMWTQQGIEIPGMDADDIRFLINEINQFPGLIELGNAMQAISRQDTWIAPDQHWMAHTLISELNSMTEKVGRKNYLSEFIENADAIFSKENLNKIEAVYGTRHREAIEDALYAMTNGRNRPAGTNKQVNQWLNWVNNSTGAIMFFNIRSAVLQTLSATNFINWSDNNPVKAAAAFANQPQFWKDFAFIFNSDKLKQRRSGLKTDVNEAEIANMAEGAQNKAAAVVAYLLKIGFTPTQIADSFAIAMGGAPYYRNRVNTYLKKGLSQEEAETKAFEDFSKTADEAQQSSDPYLVSQQQRSVLGRLVLAFQNTPMQYTRLMKKAMLDLANNRGDTKTNVSKIIYYGAVQNFIFSALQTALFAAVPGFDDEDDENLTEKELEKKQRKEDLKLLRIVNSMTDSILKGSGVAGAVLSTIKNTVTEYFVQKEKGFLFDRSAVLLQVASLSPPIGSKLRKINSAMSGEIFDKDVLAARGFDVMKDGRVNLSPAYSIIGNLLSATTNVPMDRMVDLINGYSEALDSRNSTWQRIALSLGWKTWDVGAKNEEHDLIKQEAKQKRKEEGKVKAKKTREENKKKKANKMEADWKKFSKGMSDVKKGRIRKQWEADWKKANK